ncbi:MAG: LuxR C-terminal-related transcriptional regulator [Anaerolineae bacterium]|jgi:LuxR family maltose regulon positive regulatory protein
MSRIPLLQTKLYVPPVRAELVSRPRLVERLSAGPDHKLTVVSAPAGFGKTTLVTQWLKGAQCPSAWLALDEGDNDLARFLTYLVVALQTIEAEVGKGALSVLQAPQPPSPEAVLIPLINDLAAIPGTIVLVLDDYHLIDAQPVHDALTFLLEHLPPPPEGMHLVLASREDPPLPLARLRARGHLTEVRASDLRFTSSEAAEFLNRVMGLDLSPEDVAALERRTEGWIAGLQLAALSMQGRKDTSNLVKAFTGSHRYVLDYLIEEVLEQQSESVQTFLQQTAVLNRLTGSLCDALTGQDNGQATLEMLERANLFIVPLDDERRWYRYHHLFADLLGQRLRQGQPEQLSALHRKASVWYEQNGLADEAIEHAIATEDFGRTMRLIENVIDAMWGQAKHSMLQRWLDRLPIELVLTRPHLSVFLARHLFASGQQDAAERALQAAERALDPNSDLATLPSLAVQDRIAGSERMKLLGRIAATRSSMASYRSDSSGILPHAQQALEHLPEQDVFWRGSAAIALGDAYVFQGRYVEAQRIYLEALELTKLLGNPYLSLNVNNRRALTLKSQGRLQQVLELCPQQLELASRSGISQTEPAGWLSAIWGEALAEVDDLDGAIDRAKTGVELVKRGRDVAMLTWSYLCLTRVLFSRGDLAGAEKVIIETEKTAQASTVPLWVTNSMAAWQVRVWLARDRLDEALQWMQKRQLDPDAEPTYVGALEYIALARIFIAQARYEDATRLLQRLLEPAASGGHASRSIEILLLQAMAFQAGGDTAQAIDLLERALSLAEPGGFVRIFVDEGPPLAHLLYKAAERGIAPEYTRRLLAAFFVAATEAPEPTETQHAESELVEPLSERELEVLQLVAEGLTNQEIATRLYLSLNTVKAHTRNIYGKLAVHNRTQAVAKARTLGILPFT